MRTHSVVDKPVNVITDITCDLCGNSCRVNDFEDFGEGQFSFGTLSFYGSFGCPHDTEQVNLEFCAQCVMKLQAMANAHS